MKNQLINKLLKIALLVFSISSCSSELSWKANKKENLTYLASEVAKFGEEGMNTSEKEVEETPQEEVERLKKTAKEVDEKFNALNKTLEEAKKQLLADIEGQKAIEKLQNQLIEAYDKKLANLQAQLKELQGKNLELEKLSNLLKADRKDILTQRKESIVKEKERLEDIFEKYKEEVEVIKKESEFNTQRQKIDTLIENPKNTINAIENEIRKLDTYLSSYREALVEERVKEYEKANEDKFIYGKNIFLSMIRNPQKTQQEIEDFIKENQGEEAYLALSKDKIKQLEDLWDQGLVVYSELEKFYYAAHKEFVKFPEVKTLGEIIGGREVFEKLIKENRKQLFRSDNKVIEIGELKVMWSADSLKNITNKESDYLDKNPWLSYVTYKGINYITYVQNIFVNSHASYGVYIKDFQTAEGCQVKSNKELSGHNQITYNSFPYAHRDENGDCKTLEYIFSREENFHISKEDNHILLIIILHFLYKRWCNFYRLPYIKGKTFKQYVEDINNQQIKADKVRLIIYKK